MPRHTSSKSAVVSLMIRYLAQMKTSTELLQVPSTASGFCFPSPRLGNTGTLTPQMKQIYGNRGSRLAKSVESTSDGVRRANCLRPAACMGVNHGGRGTNPPRICSGGTLIQVVPQIFVIFQNFKRSPWIRPPPQISTQIYATGCLAASASVAFVERVSLCVGC
jgi:hypothetical protein